VRRFALLLLKNTPVKTSIGTSESALDVFVSVTMRSPPESAKVADAARVPLLAVKVIGLACAACAEKKLNASTAIPALLRPVISYFLLPSVSSLGMTKCMTTICMEGKCGAVSDEAASD
jgi:hypothetical protein